jgi:hypothetical protein
MGIARTTYTLADQMARKVDKTPIMLHGKPMASRVTPREIDQPERAPLHGGQAYQVSKPIDQVLMHRSSVRTLALLPTSEGVKANKEHKPSYATLTAITLDARRGRQMKREQATRDRLLAIRDRARVLLTADSTSCVTTVHRETIIRPLTPLTAIEAVTKAALEAGVKEHSVTSQNKLDSMGVPCMEFGTANTVSKGMQDVLASLATKFQRGFSAPQYKRPVNVTDSRVRDLKHAKRQLAMAQAYMSEVSRNLGVNANGTHVQLANCGRDLVITDMLSRRINPVTEPVAKITPGKIGRTTVKVQAGTRYPGNAGTVTFAAVTTRTIAAGPINTCGQLATIQSGCRNELGARTKVVFGKLRPIRWAISDLDGISGVTTAITRRANGVKGISSVIGFDPKKSHRSTVSKIYPSGTLSTVKIHGDIDAINPLTEYRSMDYRPFVHTISVPGALSTFKRRKTGLVKASGIDATTLDHVRMGTDVDYMPALNRMFAVAS